MCCINLAKMVFLLMGFVSGTNCISKLASVMLMPSVCDSSASQVVHDVSHESYDMIV